MVDQLQITPLHATIGARVHGLDLCRPVSDALRDAIDAAMDRHAVLVFPEQELDDEQHVAFASRFGPIEDAASGVKDRNHRLANRQINDISNLAADGAIMAADDRSRLYSLANLLWHSDSSFKAVPAKYSLLHARVIPPEGGETEFADMRAAWDALPQKLQRKVRDLVCDHSIIFSRTRLGFEAFSAQELQRAEPVSQRLVRRHASTGRFSLFLSAHIGRIQGWQTPEALLLISDLTEFSTQRQFVYQHVWSRHDLVIWDNRATMHRGRPFDTQAYPRDMRRVTVRGEASTLSESA